jgi:glycosyltransferase involved in cell wall biosynthesis
MKKILIFCDYPFPEGLAATNRILAYTKGLNENGINSEIITISPYGIKIGTIFESVKIYESIYCHHPHFYYLNGSKFRRILIDLNLFKIKGFLLLLKLINSNKYDHLIISTDRKRYLFLILPLLSLLKINIGFISDEYPPDIRKLKNKISKFNYICYKFLNRFFQFRIVISNSLKEYYNTNFGEKPTYVLNTIIDEKRYFNNFKKSFNNNTNRITYVGNCELFKDNVDNIIRAFNYLKNDYPNLIFEIYGDPKERDRLILESLIRDLNLERRVLLMGKIDFHLVPDILTNSMILVSSQPKTVRANGGFPTKLGEYLLSGRPTLLTDVGEISQYIIDGENGFLVSSENPLEYAQKIKYMLENYEFCQKVGLNGKSFILRKFTSQIASKGLAAFLTKLIKK